ncbi:FAD:protein FMN transferase [Eubacteriales bacterium DFI.9.88]|nr:FAD:protein FMN transferase [Eubacteriales bacterium DFI.9.88]
MKFIKKSLLLVVCMCIIITQTGCGSEEPVSENQFRLDTICTITIYDLKKSQAQDALDKAFACIKDYENMLSKTVEGSDVYKINHAGGKPVAVHGETMEVIQKGIEYGQLSQGMFDITIGALSDLWDFTGNNPRVPDEEQLKKAVKTVDYRKVKVEGDTAALTDKDARLDLGGIAKGYIADRVTEVLEKAGVKKAIIDLGGNIVTIGSKGEGKPWKIGIERPYSDRSEILGAVEMVDATIVTSGVYERYFEAGGKLYHHVLNPKTGYPIENNLDAVTIKAGKGQSVDCDILGTVCLMLGMEKSRELLAGMDGIQAAFIDKNDKVTEINGMKVMPEK